MSYPYAVATGNAVIAAALAWDDGGNTPDEQFALDYALEVAIAAHREATATVHVNGPDIDTVEAS